MNLSSFTPSLRWLIIWTSLIPLLLAKDDYSSSLSNNNLGWTDPTEFPLGCSPNVTTPKNGLSMELYSYDYLKSGSNPCWDAAYLDPNYPRTGYKSHRLLAKVENVAGNINFYYHAPMGCTSLFDTLPQAYNYRTPLTMTNFTMLLYGYFKPKVTGYHTFTISADDLLFVNFGAGNAFDCCKRESSADDFGNYQAYAVWGSQTAKDDLTVHLDAGLYYPIRIFFNNRDNDGALSLTLKTESDSNPVIDFSDYFYSFDDTKDGCPGLVSYDTSCASVDSSTIIGVDYLTETPNKNLVPITKTIYHLGIPCTLSTTGKLCSTGFYDPLADSCVPTTILSTLITSEPSSESSSETLYYSSSRSPSSSVSYSEHTSINSSSPISSITNSTPSLSSQYTSTKFSSITNSTKSPYSPSRSSSSSDISSETNSDSSVYTLPSSSKPITSKTYQKNSTGVMSTSTDVKSTTLCSSVPTSKFGSSRSLESSVIDSTSSFVNNTYHQSFTTESGTTSVNSSNLSTQISRMSSFSTFAKATTKISSSVQTSSHILQSPTTVSYMDHTRNRTEASCSLDITNKLLFQQCAFNSVPEFHSKTQMSRSQIPFATYTTSSDKSVYYSSSGSASGIMVSIESSIGFSISKTNSENTKNPHSIILQIQSEEAFTNYATTTETSSKSKLADNNDSTNVGNIQIETIIQGSGSDLVTMSGATVLFFFIVQLFGMF